MIRDVAGRDQDAIRAIVTHAFGRDDEADLVERLRSDGDVLFEFVAGPDDAPEGHILFSRLAIVRGAETLHAAALAPVSVLPARQSSGIGASLIRAGLTRCRALDLAAVAVLGHPAYYPRFGFDAAVAARLAAPFSGPAFMAIELHPGVLIDGGRVRYAAGFGV